MCAGPLSSPSSPSSANARQQLGESGGILCIRFALILSLVAECVCFFFFLLCLCSVVIFLIPVLLTPAEGEQLAGGQITGEGGEIIKTKKTCQNWGVEGISLTQLARRNSTLRSSAASTFEFQFGGRACACLLLHIAAKCGVMCSLF